MLIVVASNGGACKPGDGYDAAVRVRKSLGFEIKFTAGKLGQTDKDVNVILGVYFTSQIVRQLPILTCSSRHLPTPSAIPGALASTRVISQPLPQPSLAPRDLLHRLHRLSHHLVLHLAPILARINVQLMAKPAHALLQQRARSQAESPRQVPARMIRMMFRSVFCSNKRSVLAVS